MRCVTSLYSHQQAAVEKLLPTRVGALLMEQGTGKTRAAIELAALRAAAGRINRVVWCCPVSLKTTIVTEILKHTDCEPSDIYAFDEKAASGRLPPAFWYVVGIESVSSSDRVTLALNSLVNDQTKMIVDESSYIKGFAAKRTRRLTMIGEKARYRMILTGTPISQGVVDLYAQMRFLSPDILGYRSFYSFAHNHLEYSDRYPGMIMRSHNTALLAAKMQPYIYQVTKAECLDLPDKIHDRMYCRLTKEQIAAYNQAKEEFLDEEEWRRDPYRSRFSIFQLFTALQEIVSGFWNRKGELLEFPHERILLLQGALCGAPETEKVIIWCKFRYSVEQIRNSLEAEYGAGCAALLYGDLNERQRQAEIAKFRAGARFLIATQSTGGHGFTFNEAHNVVFYENGFKYSERKQAEDRCHRIGQTEKVTYTDLISTSGIDERIQAALRKKANAVESFRRQVERVKDVKGGVAELVRAL